MLDFLLDRVLPVLALLGLWIFLVAPGRSTDAQKAPFMKRTFAHRGLYTPDQQIPENALPAFHRAVEAGYGVELDVQRTKDGQIVVFHDDTLLRMCGVTGAIRDYTFEELSAFFLSDRQEHIPLLTQVLACIGGRVPMIIEFKYGPDWTSLCEDTMALLSAYDGPYCVESFHPRIVRWFRLHAPHILRGQLSEAFCFSRKSLSFSNALLMSRLLTNFLTRPQFIAYRVGPRCLSARLAKRLGAMEVCWTARPEHDWSHLTKSADSIIFEHREPPRQI